MKKKIEFTRRNILLIVLGVMLVVILILGTMYLVRVLGSDSERRVSPDDLPSLEAIRDIEKYIYDAPSEMLYGLPVDEYEVQQGEIQKGETLSKLLNGKFDVSIALVNTLVDKSKGVFDLRDLRLGNGYTAFLSPDSTARLEYLVYEKNRSEFVVFCCTDEPSVKSHKKEITTKEQFAQGTINSSLSMTIQENGQPQMLVSSLENIFKWSIDFFALQKGDSYRVIYEEQFIDTLSAGIGKIYGAEFIHNGKSYLAVRFEQDGEIGYWDAEGKNLKKSFLRAPLSFQARISSRFGMRIHPIKRTRGQHNGVDYACAAGTHVYAVADGTVIKRGWDPGGGGNMIKIQHAQNLASGYLHLRGFAPGIKQGVRVRQGQLIGYVGSTGQSTGPHLDYRIWQSGKPIDPLKLPSLPTEPIKKANRGAFDVMKKDVLDVLKNYAAPVVAKK